MSTLKHGRFIFLKRGHRPEKMGFQTLVHSPTHIARAVLIPLLGALMIVYTIGFAVSYTGHNISPYILVGLGFLIFLPIYIYYTDVFEDSILDQTEYREDESKYDVIIDTVERKLIIHDTHAKEDFSIAFDDITGFETKIEVSVNDGVKTAWTAWVLDEDKSYLLGVSDWEEDLEDLLEKIKSFLEEVPKEDVIDLYGEAYEVLGVSSEASVTEIKKAYRGLAKTYHPDMGGDDETFKRINEAYLSLIEVR